MKFVFCHDLAFFVMINVDRWISRTGIQNIRLLHNYEQAAKGTINNIGLTIAIRASKCSRARVFNYFRDRR